MNKAGYQGFDKSLVKILTDEPIESKISEEDHMKIKSSIEETEIRIKNLPVKNFSNLDSEKMLEERKLPQPIFPSFVSKAKISDVWKFTPSDNKWKLYESRVSIISNLKNEGILKVIGIPDDVLPHPILSNSVVHSNDFLGTEVCDENGNIILWKIHCFKTSIDMHIINDV